MSTHTLFYDIETQPLPLAELEAFIPPFNERDVKVGNLKDPEKIAAKIEEARAGHRQSYVDRAALNPVTASIAAVGIKTGGKFQMVDGEEKPTLETFWKAAEAALFKGGLLVSFNGHGFDLPFLIKRSWRLGVRIPNDIREGRWWGRQLLDLSERWSFNERRGDQLPGLATLDTVARFLGLAGKNGKGADFYKLPLADKFNYLRQDVELLEQIYNRIG